MKLLVCGSAVGARHVVPLQLRPSHTVATFIEFAMDLPRVCEKSELGNVGPKALNLAGLFKSGNCGEGCENSAACAGRFTLKGPNARSFLHAGRGVEDDV